MRNRGSEAVRVVGAVVAVLALCVVVGIASSARSAEDAAEVAFDSRAAASLLSALMVLFFIGFLALAIRVLLAILRSKDDDGPEEEEEPSSALEVTTPLWLQRLIVAGIVAMIALCAWVTWLVVRSFLATAPPPDDAGTGQAQPPPPLVGPVGSDAILPDIVVFLLLGLIVGLLLVTVLVLLRRPPDDDELVAEVELPPDRIPLEGDPFLIDVDALAQEAPRAAVIIGFALAQRMLAGAGYAAQWDETSAEHVQRVGPTLPGAAPPALDHLLALYHEAKFSEHPITDQHRRDAIAALGQLRDTLQPLALAAVPSGGAA